MITKEELKAKINFNVDSEKIISIYRSKTEGLKYLEKVSLNSESFPCNYFTFNYVLTKFNIRNLHVRELKEHKIHPIPIEKILFMLSQTLLHIKKKFGDPGKDLSIDSLIIEIICDELLEEYNINDSEFFKSLKFQEGKSISILL
jgi:hypothetical protein